MYTLMYVCTYVQGWLTGFPMLVLQVTCLIACALSFLPRSCPAPYAVNIIRRWGMMEAMGSILRFFTYISTTLPGAADHCVPSKSPHTRHCLYKLQYLPRR